MEKGNINIPFNWAKTKILNPKEVLRIKAIMGIDSIR